MTWRQLPGGYPAAPGYVPPGPAAPAPQPGAPAPMPAAPPGPGMVWVPPGPPGAPIEGAAPFYPPQPGQPAPVPGQPQPGYAPAPAPAPVAGGLDLASRLDGPHIPLELRGKTVAEAMQIYGGMRNIVLQTPYVAGAQPSPQPAAPAQPAPGAPGQLGQPNQGAEWDWRSPKAAIQGAVAEALQPVLGALQPIMMREAVNGIQEARNQVAATIPNFLQLEPLILQKLQGADPQTLRNPEMWRTAAHAVVGEMYVRGAAPGQLAQPAPAPGGFPAQPVQPGVQPMPNLQGFYSEPPSGGAPTGGAPQLSAQQDWARQQMGMSTEDYFAWSGGAPAAGARR